MDCENGVIRQGEGERKDLRRNWMFLPIAAFGGGCMISCCALATTTTYVDDTFSPTSNPQGLLYYRTDSNSSGLSIPGTNDSVLGTTNYLQWNDDGAGSGRALIGTFYYSTGITNVQPISSASSPSAVYAGGTTNGNTVPDSVTLGSAVGDTLTLSFNMNITNSPKYGGGIEFGLYDAQVAGVYGYTYQGGSYRADNSIGYQVEISDSSTAPGASLLRYNSGNTSSFMWGNNVTALSTSATQVITSFNTHDYLATMTLTNEGSGKVEVAYSLGYGSTVVASGSGLDTSGITTFDAFGFTSYDSERNMDLTNIELTAGTPTYTATTYALSASASGSALSNGRVTQGQSISLTAGVENTGTGTDDTLDYTGLNITGQSLSPQSGGPLAQGASGYATGTYTVSTRGTNTFTPTVGSATNATINGNATLSGSTSTSVYVDALAEHVTATGISDTNNAATTPTPFYRMNSAYGGNNLGSVTVTKTGNGSYIPGYVTGLNSGNGYDHGTLSITVAPNGSQFSPDTSIILLGFKNVNSNNSSTESELSALETDLTNADIAWKDFTGASDSYWSTQAGSGADPLTSLDHNASVGNADYDLELAFSGPTGNQSYFDFNFAGELTTAGDVVNIAVVPEPATTGLLLMASLPLVWRQRRRRN